MNIPVYLGMVMLELWAEELSGAAVWEWELATLPHNAAGKYGGFDARYNHTYELYQSAHKYLFLHNLNNKCLCMGYEKTLSIK